MAAKTRNLIRELSSTLSASTYDVDSPAKARERANLLKSTAPFAGRNCFDTMRPPPRATYVYSTLLDSPLTVEMIRSAKKIRPYQFEIPIEGDKNRLRVELKDGTNWIVKIPEPNSDACKELNRTSNQITETFEKWAKEGWARELRELKWKVYSEEQLELSDKTDAAIWDRDLITRQTKSDIQEKLANDHVFFVQKQRSFGTPSFCSYVFCPAPEGRTPLGSYRLSLEPRDNMNLLKVPEDPIRLGGKRGYGVRGVRWFCLTCVEAIWNGVDLITPETLAEIAVKVAKGKIGSNMATKKSGNTNAGDGNQAETTSKGGRKSPAIVRNKEKIPLLPTPPAPPAPFTSLSQSLYSFMYAETREQEHNYYKLPLPQHAALLKWKTTIVRRTENEVKSNIECRKRNGILLDCKDPGGDFSHDEKYWIQIQDSESHAQLRGLVDPLGKIVELCTAECRDKELSEIFRTIDARVQDEWDSIGYVPQPPRPKRIVVLKFDYLKYFPHLRDATYPRRGDVRSDTSGDITESSSSEEEL
ncbi:hypothetical protein GP486_000850 [Trichoglossum hirsutum]|uniref:Uncharacterized protein n=1 Tax=Trichoglossum hirsutum TaxID=265104 RepID=A0A9P8RT60_9PEZI|nr:hypothetical protein GP486_000850 [Trichoglossum hirsutum]